MRKSTEVRHLACVAVFAAYCCFAVSQNTAPSVEPSVKESDIRAEMNSLASDAMRGRGSGTVDELRAGEYIASQFAKFGIRPAGDKTANGKKGFIQTVVVTKQQFATPPVLTVSGERFIHGKDMAVLRASSNKLSGPLQKVGEGAKATLGSIAYIHVSQNSPAALNAQIMSPLRDGAAAVVIAYNKNLEQRFKTASGKLPELPVRIGDEPPPMATSATIILLDEDASEKFDGLKGGANVDFSGELKGGAKGKTWNVVGVLPGHDPKLAKEVVLLTAHMDHLGTDPKLKGDQIYNGADDDASGVIAVLELARALGHTRPERTVYFVTFGSEEKGGYGAQYFLEHPPVPIADMTANLEFEMIGRPDPAVNARALWLTGYERSNLGPELAKHGGRLVADPHPEQNFFMRSDNYALAKKGVVAQTVSSFGLHKDYHKPSDDIAHIDFAHMTTAIGSMVVPVEWLVNSDFTPQWAPGKKP